MRDETYHAGASFWQIDPIIHAQINRKDCTATRYLPTVVGRVWSQVYLRPVRCGHPVHNLDDRRPPIVPYAVEIGYSERIWYGQTRLQDH